MASLDDADDITTLSIITTARNKSENYIRLISYGVFMFRTFFLLSLLLISCSPKVDKFQEAIDDSYKFMTLRQQSILSEFYPSKESRINEGKKYCDNLKSGKTREQIYNEELEPLLELIGSKKITIDESADISLVKKEIQKIGVINYCPEFIEKIPSLKERLGSN